MDMLGIEKTIDRLAKENGLRLYGLGMSYELRKVIRRGKNLAYVKRGVKI